VVWELKKTAPLEGHPFPWIQAKREAAVSTGHLDHTVAISGMVAPPDDNLLQVNVSLGEKAFLGMLCLSIGYEGSLDAWAGLGH